VRLAAVLVLRDDWLCMFRRQTRTHTITQTHKHRHKHRQQTNQHAVHPPAVGLKPSVYHRPTFSVWDLSHTRRGRYMNRITFSMYFRTCSAAELPQVVAVTGSHDCGKPFVPAAPTKYPTSVQPIWSNNKQACLPPKDHSSVNRAVVVASCLARRLAGVTRSSHAESTHNSTSSSCRVTVVPSRLGNFKSLSHIVLAHVVTYNTATTVK